MIVDESMPTILLVEADSLARRALERCLKASRFEVRSASRQDEAIAFIATHRLCLVLASFDGGPCDGAAVLGAVRSRQPTCGRVLIDDAMGVEEIAEAARRGICHVVLQRPFAISDALAYVDTSRSATLRERRSSTTLQRIGS